MALEERLPSLVPCADLLSALRRTLATEVNLHSFLCMSLSESQATATVLAEEEAQVMRRP